MQTAGINIVAKWDATEVEAGMNALNARLSKLKIPTFKFSDGGSTTGLGNLSKSANSAADAFQKLIDKRKELATVINDNPVKPLPPVETLPPSKPLPPPVEPAAISAIQQLKNELRDAKIALESFLASGGSIASKQGQELAAAYNSVNSQLKQITRSTKGSEDAYARLSRVANEATRHAQNLAVTYGVTSERAVIALNRAKSLTDGLGKVDAATGRHFRNVGNYASGYNAISVNMARIVGEMPNFTQSMRIGFMAISNNIQPLAESIQDLNRRNKEMVAQGQPTVSALKSVGAALFSWNTLLLVGVSLLTAYGPKLVEWAQGLMSGGTAAKFVKEETEALNKAQETANQSTGEQIGKLTTLNAVLQSNTASATDKRNAYEQIVKMYPAYQAELEREYRNTGSVANVIKGQLIPALIAAARARAMQSRIDDIAAKNLGIQDKKNAATKEEQRLRTAANEADKQGITIKRNAGTSAEYLEKASKSLNDQADNQLNKFKELHREQQLGEQTINSYTKAIVDITPKINNLTTGLSGAGTKGFSSAGTAAAKAAKSVKELNTELSKQPRSTETAAFDFNVYDELKKQRDSIDTEGFDLHNKLFPDLSVEIQANASKMGRATQIYVDTVNQKLLAGRKLTEEQIDALANLLQNNLANGIGSFAEGLGNVIAGVENPFGNFLAFLGGAIKEFGKYLIQVGTMSEAFKKAIAGLSISGLGAIATGIAAVAFGQVLQSQAQKKQRTSFRAFADGGVVYGPTNALIGEYSGASNNPEIVAPLDKLKSILGEGGSQKVEVVGTIKGKDLVLIMDRQTNYNNR